MFTTGLQTLCNHFTDDCRTEKGVSDLNFNTTVLVKKLTSQWQYCF